MTESRWNFKAMLPRSPGFVALAVAAAVVASPLVALFALPALGIAVLLYLSHYNTALGQQPQQRELPMQPIPASSPFPLSSEEPASIAAKADSRPHSPMLSTLVEPTEPAARPVAASTAARGSLTATTAPKPSRSSSTRTSDGPVDANKTASGSSQGSNGPVGGAAVLAKLRAQKAARAAAEAAAPKPKPITVLFASQTGTAAEIAKNIHAEAQGRGILSQVFSMNEFSLENVNAEATPVVVMVASSTGDGDPPDNAAKFYATLRRKSQPRNRLQGIKYTCLGLGDSNYTRFMHVPRSLRSRFQELGAEECYECREADEVDGLEEVVDRWVSGLWPELCKALQLTAKAQDPTEANGVPQGLTEKKQGSLGVPQGLTVPPPPRTTVALKWLEGEQRGAVLAAEAAGPSPEQLAYRDVQDNGGMYSLEQPFWATITDARYLTSPTAGDRTVIHLEMDVHGSNMPYNAGDSIGVLPENDPELVEALLKRLGLDGDAVFSVTPADASITRQSTPGTSATALLRHLRWPCSVRAALSRGCDLTTPPRKSLLRLLAEHADNGTADRENLLRLCSKEGRDAYGSEILAARSSVLDVLDAHPSCKPPLDALLEALPPLPPRMYSITCAPQACPDKVQVAFSLVRYSTASGCHREGVATAWLARLAKPWLQRQRHGDESDGTDGNHIECGNGSGPRVRVPLFLRRGRSFAPPQDLSAPWILIGPGTGVAPFRGFLQDRRARMQQTAGTAAPCWLYFGCRHPDQDYLYREDMESFVADGTLRRLEVAFSRLQADKVYVQHLMRQRSEELFDLIARKRGFVFVCGDGAAMAKDVHAALQTMIVERGDMSEGEATEMLANLAKEGRYVRDIWS